MRCRWKNGKVIPHLFARYISTIKDLSIHQAKRILIVDSFSRFSRVYPVTNTGTQATIVAVENWILHFGIPQSMIHDRGTAFLNTDFVNWTKGLGITLRPRTAHSPWTNRKIGKVETQNQHIARYWRSFLNVAGTNWAPLEPKFAFAQNTSANYTTGKTPYEIVFGAKPDSYVCQTGT